MVPIGLTVFGLVQSENWKKYLVSGCRPVASTLTVKSTSKVVKASPESIIRPDKVGDRDILKATHTGTLSSGVGPSDMGRALVHRSTDVSNGSP